MLDPMLVPDVAFNLACGVLDGLAAWGLSVALRRRTPAARLIAPGALAFSIPVVLASATASVFGLRGFAIARFAGMFLFWHLPAFLLFVSWRQGFKRWGGLIPALIALGLILVYGYAYHLEPTQLEINRHELPRSGLKGLTRPIVIAQITDLQVEQVDDYARSVFRHLAREKPDMVVYCGDYVQSWSLTECMQEREKLRRVILESGLTPPLGSFAVGGDCEPDPAWEAVFQNLPVRVLKDECVVAQLPGCQVNVIGLTLSSSRYGNASFMKRALRGRRPDLMDLYIGHAPDFVTDVPRSTEPFLALAGHTHGGQVQLPFFGPIVTSSELPREFADYFGPYGTGFLSVSRGIGLERLDAPRLRFLCRPEIRLITLSNQPN